jgi:UPF0755 protein
MVMKLLRTYIVGMLISSSLVITGLPVSYWLIKKPNFLLGKEARILIIKPHMSFGEVQAHLYQEGYISNTFSFELLARILRYDQRILPGAYKLVPKMNNWEVIRLLRSGKQTPIKLVLDHAYTKEGLITKVSQHTSIGIAEFQNLLQDNNFIAQWGFNLENVLAMFIPNTYEVYWNITPKEFFQRMHREYQRFWTPSRRHKAQSIGLTPIEVVVLASIVEKETNKLEEASIIAGIYLNRLRKGMRLQACPTLLYAAGETSAKRVLHKYRLINSPYNTYIHRGLPPGPICIPSIAMVEAVLNAAKHHYLYFSAKEDFSGFHYFAKTFDEHKKNGEKYRRALNKMKIYQ